MTNKKDKAEGISDDLNPRRKEKIPVRIAWYWDEFTRSFHVDEHTATFLRYEDDLIVLLMEACYKLRALFGTKVYGVDYADPLTQKLPVYLSMDPDEEMVWASIKTTLGGAEAAELLARFDREWWLDNADRAQGKLEFRLEFIEEATGEKD